MRLMHTRLSSSTRHAGAPRRALLAAGLLALAAWQSTALAQAAGQPAGGPGGAPAAVLAPAASAAAAPMPLAAGSAIGTPAIQPPGPAGDANPYGLRAVWGQGDLVARITLIALAVMSLGSWYIILAKLIEQRKQNQQALDARAAFAGAPSVQQGADKLAKDSPFRFVVDSALQAQHKHASLARMVDQAEWLSQDIVRNVGTLQMRMQAGLAVLATVGSTAPFVGLFGTVWGIYSALVTIGATGQASIDKVAGPVGEALIMTALGLAVAVPAVLGYNWLVRRNRLAMHAIKGFGSDLHTLLLQEAQQGQRGA